MGIADTAGLSGGSAGQSWMCNAAGGPRSQLGLGFQVGVGGEPGNSGFRLIRDPPQDYVALGGGFYAGSTAPRSFTAYANSGRPAVAASGNENSGFELMRRPPRWNHMGGQEELFAQNEDHNNSSRSLMTLSVRQRRRRGGVASNPCQDCGNQAKKDCSYQRCRTCCKSRGFQCSTHLRSTWIPAAQRRERQQVGGSSSSAPRSKRARILALAAAQSHNTTSNSTAGTSPPPSSLHHNTSTLLLTYGQQEVNSVGSSFPPEVRAAAVFKCLKISASDDAKGEYAYKATVKIGDHVFKGVLYDQGGYSSPTENQRKRSNTGDESGSFWNDDLNSNSNRIAMTGQGGGVDQVVARERMASGLGSLMDHHVTTTSAAAAGGGGGADPQRWFACGE